MNTNKTDTVDSGVFDEVVATAVFRVDSLYSGMPARSILISIRDLATTLPTPGVRRLVFALPSLGLSQSYCILRAPTRERISATPLPRTTICLAQPFDEEPPRALRPPVVLYPFLFIISLHLKNVAFSPNIRDDRERFLRDATTQPRANARRTRARST